MASRLIGRTKCPECGFDAAHVKQSDKTPYRYCPQHDCGAQYFPRGEAAKQRLLDSMRPEGSGSPAPAPVAKPAPTPAPTAAPVPAGSGSDPEPLPPAPAPTPAPRRGLPSFFR